jgi:hypothetical protein
MTRRTPPRDSLARAELRTDSIAEQIVAMSAVRQHRWTRAEVDRLIDERPGYTPRYELVDGELLVTPAPSGRHQRIVLQLALLLQPYLTRNRLGVKSYLAPASFHSSRVSVTSRICSSVRQSKDGGRPPIVLARARSSSAKCSPRGHRATTGSRSGEPFSEMRCRSIGSSMRTQRYSRFGIQRMSARRSWTMS